MGATARRQRAAARFTVSPAALVQPRVQWWGVPDLVQEDSPGTFNPQTLACSEDFRTEDRDLLEVDFWRSLEVVEVAVCDMVRVRASLWVRVSLWFGVSLWVCVPSPSFRRVKTFLCKLSTTEKEKICRFGRWWLKEEQVDGKKSLRGAKTAVSIAYLAGLPSRFTWLAYLAMGSALMFLRE